jgi:hypothetical protein
MPFTLSHAAAAIPFRRTLLVPSALVAGCFAPDFEYFLSLGPHGGFGHTLPGLFLLDLPLAFIGLWLFERYAKAPLVETLPAGVRLRLAPTSRSLSINSFSRFVLIAFSIVVGAVTHVVWDWFTHPRYWLYDHWSFLRRTASLPFVGPQRYCHIFQYISSFGGILIIAIWCVHWYRKDPAHHAEVDARSSFVTRCVFAGAFAIAIAAGFLRAAQGGIPHGILGTQRFGTELVVTAVAVFCAEWLVYGFFRRVIFRAD